MQTLHVGSIDGTTSVPVDVSGKDTVIAGREIVGDRVVLASFDSSGVALVVVDVTTGDVLTEVDALGPTSSLASRGDGSTIGITKALPDGSGEAILLDAQSGAELHVVPLSDPSDESVFDPATGEMLIVTEAGDLLTVDIAAGEVVAQVDLTTTSVVEATGIGPDGLVVVASESQIELVDRRSGPTGDVIPLRDVFALGVQPDGSVVKVDAEARTEIIQFGGTPLVEQRGMGATRPGDRAGAIRLLRHGP